ncbi:MAG: hypothetical protein DMF90_07370 [Acidobacteria bacterium]|nr:MAG: hypothetical protein DMF90_07370 [Acidobacteriota bacterium]
MTSERQPVQELLERTRARWRRLVWLRTMCRAALAAALVLACVAVAGSWLTRAPALLAGLGLLGVVLMVTAVLWGFWPAREHPTDARLARFIEERVPDLDERVVSAVHLVSGDLPGGRPELADAMLADANRAVSSLDPASIVPPGVLRRAALQALAAGVVLGLVMFASRNVSRRTFDAVSLAMFPERVVLDVVPGNARVQVGAQLTIEARLAGNRAPVVARLLRAGAAAVDGWQAQEMSPGGAGQFTSRLDGVAETFRYRVSVGSITSPTFTVDVVKPPRVKRIDVEYSYPKTLGLAPRLEEDGGDIYAPAGTEVRVRVYPDRPASGGRLVLGAGAAVNLLVGTDGSLSGPLQVAQDNSYRVSLVDAEGLESAGDTEYFVRMIEDRPPEVHVSKPARDRRVTRLEEVDIEVEAHDDFGVERLDLVYGVRGGAERIVPLGFPRRSTSVTGKHTLFLEDLDVAPGDFISYYARARDLPRGKRSSEARSDIFFLEVKPFEEEFTLLESQAGAGGSGRNHQIDDLVAAQKEIIVATWKLDRRAQLAGAKSEQDIKSVAAAQTELKTRVQEVASAFRATTMRDPRRRTPQGGRGPQGSLPGPQLAEEDAMTAAAAAMGKAATSLNGLRTGEALPAEMEALNQLLRAQAEITKRQVQRQQAGRGSGGNRSDADLSTLFDRELSRQQQTSYENAATPVQGDQQDASALDDIKDLARRQDELLQRQRDLLRDRDSMDAEAVKRELEKLTRDQSELRQHAEDLARKLGQTGRGGQVGRAGQAGQAGKDGDPARAMSGISEEMRTAAGNLRRQDASRASERSARALERLRELERTMRAGTPDDRRRALGDLQLEARQLAETERQIASEADRIGQGRPDGDALRRLAGEQERAAERTRRVQEGLKQQAGSDTGAAGGRGGKTPSTGLEKAAGEAARDLDRQRILERLQQAASAMRAAGDPSARDSVGGEQSRLKAAAESGRQVAKSLDDLADKLASVDPAFDAESRKLSGQLARARELRERLDSLDAHIEALGKSNGGAAGLGDQMSREMQQIQELLDQLKSEDKDRLLHAGRGTTFEAPGRMILSAPGTEAFKQDFAKWHELKKQASVALQGAETELARRLQEKQSKDRLAAGADDKVSREYQQQVDRYFRALAAKKK